MIKEVGSPPPLNLLLLKKERETFKPLRTATALFQERGWGEESSIEAQPAPSLPIHRKQKLFLSYLLRPEYDLLSQCLPV